MSLLGKDQDLKIRLIKLKSRLILIISKANVTMLLA